MLDRVARRLDEGLEILNVNAYCYGIARLLLHEVGARGDRQRAALSELSTRPSAVVEDDAEMACLERCLQRLDGDSRALILEYYEGERRGRQEHRRVMAERLGIGPNALRIRLHRVRRLLEACLVGCLGEAETNGPMRSLPSGGRDGVR